MLIFGRTRTSLAFLLSFAVLLTFTSVSEANSLAPPQARSHVELNRMIKKRAPALLPPIARPAADPTETTTSAASAPTGTGGATGSSSTPTNVSNTSTNTATTTASGSSTTTSGSVTSSDASSTASSSASTSSSSTSAATSATTPPAQQPAPVQTTPPKSPGQTKGQSRVTATITDSQPSQTDDTPAKKVETSSKVTKTTLIVIVVIAASIGVIFGGWTIIRKVKFKPSSSFEDRMNPIDWRPTDDRDDVPGLHRNTSSASHGSFHSSGHGHDNHAGRGMGAYGGNGSDHGHNALQPLPEHDFTAGPAHLAPVGGYADLARGPSPQPQMSQVPYGNDASYGVPLHHQGAYDYNANARY